MRVKLNENETAFRFAGGSSDIYRYFKYYFDSMLDPLIAAGQPEVLKALAIPLEDVQQQLAEFFQKGRCSLGILLGFKGIGKSTALRYAFNTWKSDDVLVGQDRIVIYLGCDNTTIKLSSREFFSSGIKQVIDNLSENAPFSDSDLWHYIKKTRPSALTRKRPGNFTSIEEDLRQLLMIDELSYNVLLMKFLIRNRLPDLKELFIIFDDVESLNSRDIRNEYINEVDHLFQCLVNKAESYCIKILMAERPFTYRDFYKNDWSIPPIEINISRAVPLVELFQRRHNYVIATDRPEALERLDYQKALDFLKMVVSKIESSAGSLMLALGNYDVRVSSTQRFEEAVCICQGIVSLEGGMVEAAAESGSLGLCCSVFGSESISSHLLKGVYASLEREYGGDVPEGLSKGVAILEKSVKDIQSKLDRVV